MSTPLEQTVAEVLGAHCPSARSYLGSGPERFLRGGSIRCGCGVELSVPRGQMATHVHRAHVAAVLTRVVEAEVLEAAAEAWQMNTWADVVTPALKTTGIPALAVGQAVTDWLRDRARVARGGGS